MSRLFLLDGHSLAYRAFFALPTDLANTSGTVTNAVYGFTSMLVKLLADERPDGIAVVFDAPGRTFRDDLDEGYKATRNETPSLFASQMPLLREVLDVLRIPVVEVAGVEADDVIATLATAAAARGDDVVVVSGDRDSFQLVADPHVKVLYNRRGVSDYVLYDEAGIVKRCAVTAAQYPEYAAMRGDASDNLPGVPGIGEKTAASLLQRFSSLEGVYAHIEELPPKQRQNLAEWRDRVFLNLEMTWLRRDVPEALALSSVDLVQGAWDPEDVRVLFNQLSFRTLLNRLLETVGGASESEAKRITAEAETLREAAKVEGAVREIRRRGERFAVEPSWDGVAGHSPLSGLALSLEGESPWFVDASLLRDAQVLAAFSDLFAADGPPLVAHRAKELMNGLALLGSQAGVAVVVRNLDLDTAIMAYLLDPAEGRYLLEELAQRYCSLEIGAPGDSGARTLDFDGRGGADEAGRRALAALQLAKVLEETLEEQGLGDLYRDMERPLVEVLHDMERVGVRVDVTFLRELSSELSSECSELQGRIHALAGEEFNVNSTPQLRRILYDKLGLTPVKKTKTGASTDASSLGKLVGEHPIVGELLRYREVEKLRSTYADALPPLVGTDGRIHAVLNQTGTATGRISSESPNLQNVPVRTEQGRELRRAFIAEDGCELVVADYSQIELRVIAHLTEDPGLLEAFGRDADVHTTTAARVFGTEEAKVTTAQRRIAKMVNYGLAYGMEAYGLAQRLDIPPDQAREILDAYFASFPNVRAFMDATIEQARACGYTTTLLGRRRRVPELASDNFRIRQMGERMAQNAPAQGSAADIFKLAMVRLYAELTARGMRSRMVLTVHDELVLEAPFDEREETSALVREVMESAYELRVPLKVDLSYGQSWAEAKR